MSTRQPNRQHQLYRDFFTRYEHSGLTIREFCTREHVTTKTFYYRRKRLRMLSGIQEPHGINPVGTAMELLPVIVNDTPGETSSPYYVRFPNELRLTVPAHFSTTAVAELIRLCRECR